jgi:membrane associated rhomboid family serine protease
MRSWQATGEFGAGGGLSFPALTPVVKRLLLVNFAIWVLLFLLSLVAPGLLESRSLDLDGRERLHGLLPLFGATPYLWFDGFPWVYPWQPLTYGLLHSPVQPMHLLFNALGLYFFGTMLEGTLGSRRFLGFYLLAIAVAGAVSLMAKPLIGSYGPTIGASGGVFAVLCACATMRPQATVIFWFFPLPLAWLAIGLVGLDLVVALQQVFRGFDSGSDRFAHLAGALFGFLAVRRGFVWRDLFEEAEGRRRTRRAEAAASDEARLDELLARIHSEGIQSLSEREKAFLKRISKRD